MDRLDYLGRDSFYTGVSEGIIGSDRIIHMLNVVDDELVIEEKGIYSIEKFIIARRLMYWQVYLHKTVVATDVMLTNIIKRAAELSRQGQSLPASPALQFFLNKAVSKQAFLTQAEVLEQFVALDDADVLSAIKQWQTASDKVLSKLSQALINRHLPKVKIANKPFTAKEIEAVQDLAQKRFKVSEQDAPYFASMNTLANNAYKVEKQTAIRILMKTGEVLDVTDASDNYNLKALNQTVKKYCLSFYP
jgi:HD superfamily phosphohydrolase